MTDNAKTMCTHPIRDKITFKTLDESDEVFDMSCVMYLGFSLETVCAHTTLTGSKRRPSNRTGKQMHDEVGISSNKSLAQVCDINPETRSHGNTTRSER